MRLNRAWNDASSPDPAKTRLIEAIKEVNRSAATDWLDCFDEAALREYLAHLQITLEPRGTSWVRRGDTPAVVSRDPRF